MKKNFSVLIPDAESGHSLIVARALAEVKGIVIHTLGKDPRSALKYSFRKKSFKPMETDDLNEIKLNALIKHINRTKADILFPVDQPAHRFMSLHKTELSKYIRTTPVAPIDIFDVATNKWKLSLFLIKNKIPCPETQLIENNEIVEDIFDKIEFPIIAKPAKGYGGLGIKKLSNKEEAVKFFKSIPVTTLGNYIIQKFIDGYDIDCSLLAKEGKLLAYTIQKGFIARTNAFDASAGINFLYIDKLYKIVEECISQLNFSGIAHLDFRYDKKDDKFRLIEVNARYWGSLTGSQIVGVNFPYLACLTSLGEKYDIPKYSNGRYIDHTTAAKRMIKELFRSNPDNIKYRETDFKFIFQDPIAEILNIFKRRL